MVPTDEEQTAHDAMLNSYLHLFSISILYYDWALTFPLEISNIWRTPIKTSAILFIFNRYLSIIGNVFVTMYNMKQQTSQSYDLAHQIFIIINQTFVGLLLILRTWALYGRDSRILFLMIGVAFALLGVASWSQVGQQSSYATDIPGCNVAYSNKGASHLAVAWEALFAFDSLIFILTILKTYNGRHRRQFISLRRINIVSLVLRDGAIYYAVMVLANLANILTYYLARPMLKGCLTSFTSCISVTLISRLMLNLHSTASAGILSTVPTSDTSGRVAFTTRVPDDIHFPVNGNDRDFEMQGTIPTQSLQAGAEHVVEEPGRHGIEVERRSGI